MADAAAADELCDAVDQASAAPGLIPTPPFEDNTSIVRGSDDATKTIRFEVDGLSGSTVRVLTPLDKDYTLEETGHASKHQSGGSDPLQLDNLAAPDDNSDLNASVSAHGLLRKLSGTASEFLNGAGSWASPASTIKLDDLATPDDNTDLNASASVHGLLRKLDGDSSHFLDGTGQWASPAPFTDDSAIVKGSGNSTKRLRFEVDGFSPSTTRVLTPLDKDYTIEETVHATKHQAGGSDAIRLDDLASPEDNTDLNASTSTHGLLPKLDNVATHFLDGTGAWSTVSVAPFTDSTSIVKGSSDPTKLLRFEVDGFTSGQTRVLTPLDKNYTVEETGHATKHQSGGADAIQLDNLAAPDDNTDLNATASAHGLLPKLDNVSTNFLNGTGAWSAPATAPFTDSTAIVKGSSDPTKLLRFEVDGFTTATTRVLTPPNQDTTIAGLSVAETFTANQTIHAHAAVGTDATIDVPLSVPAATRSISLISGETVTATTGNYYGGFFEILANPSGASSTGYVGSRIQLTSQSGNANNMTGTFAATYSGALHGGSGTVSECTGHWVVLTNNSGGTVNVAYGVRAQVLNAGAGTIGTATGVDVDVSASGASSNYSFAGLGGTAYFETGAIGEVNLMLFQCASGTQTASMIEAYDKNSSLLFEVAASGAATHKVLNSVTNAVTNVLTVTHNSSGTPAAGFGAGIPINLNSSTTDDTSAALIEVTWATATHASRKARMVMSVYDTAVRECLRFEASGTAPMVGAYGVAAVARPSAFTQTYSTADKTHANFTSSDLTGITSSTTGSALAEPSASYTRSEMQQNFRRIQDQFVNLRADVADLKQLANAIIDDLQSIGWLQ